jgi:hypothetical protein
LKQEEYIKMKNYKEYEPSFAKAKKISTIKESIKALKEAQTKLKSLKEDDAKELERKRMAELKKKLKKATMGLGTMLLQPGARDHLKKVAEEKLKKNHPDWSAEELGAKVEAEVSDEMAKRFKAAYDLAAAAGDQDKAMSDISTHLQNHPDLYIDQAAARSEVGKRSQDVGRMLSNLKDTPIGGAKLEGIFSQELLTNDYAQIAASEKFQKLTEGGGDQALIAEAWLDAVSTNKLDGMRGKQYYAKIADDRRSVVFAAPGPDVAPIRYATRRSAASRASSVQAPPSTFAAATSGLSEGVRNNLKNALSADGGDPDVFAKRMAQRIDAAQATYLQSNARAYMSPPPVPSPEAPLSQAMAPLVASVYVPGQAQGVPAPADFRGHVISTALDHAVYGETKEERAEGVRALANTNFRDLETDTLLQKQVVHALDGRMDEFGKAIQEASGDAEAFKKMEGVVQSLVNTSQKVAAKSAADMTDTDRALMHIGEQMVTERVVEKVAKRRKGKGNNAGATT